MSRGHIRERKGPKGIAWEVRVYAGEGRIVTRTTREGKKAAQRLLTELLTEVDRGQHGGPTGTVDDLLDRWWKHASPDWSPSTADAYETYVRLHVRPHLGHVKVRAVRPADLDDLYATLRQGGMKPASIYKVHTILRGAFDDAVRWRWITHNPAADADPPKVTKPELQPPDAATVRKLLDLAEKRDPAFAVYLAVAADTGARRGELVALRWRHVDLEAGELTIERAVVLGADGALVEKDTKTHAARRIALGAPCVETLRDHRRRSVERAFAVGVALADDAYLFSNELDGSVPWRPDGATSRFMSLRKQAKVAGVRLHDLRHALITDWLAAGVDPRTVMGRVGHASLQTLTRYAHFVPAADRAAADRLADRHQPADGRSA